MAVIPSSEMSPAFPRAVEALVRDIENPSARKYLLNFARLSSSHAMTVYAELTKKGVDADFCERLYKDALALNKLSEILLLAAEIESFIGSDEMLDKLTQARRELVKSLGGE